MANDIPQNSTSRPVSQQTGVVKPHTTPPVPVKQTIQLAHPKQPQASESPREQVLEEQNRPQTNEANAKELPPPKSPASEVLEMIRERVQLGLSNIDVALTVAIFKQQADILLRDPSTPTEVKAKIEQAKYDTGTESQAKAGLAIAVHDIIYGNEQRKLKGLKSKYENNANYEFGAVQASIEILKLVEKYGSLNDPEALKELYSKGTTFNNLLNNRKILEQSLDIIVKEVDEYMDRARLELANPDKHSQELAQTILAFADKAIAAEDAARRHRELLSKYGMWGLRGTLAVA